MWLSLLLLLIVLAIAIRQGPQGLFRAFIMTVLTVCCAATALGTYEWVTNHWIRPIWPKDTLNTDFMLPLMLGITFGVPLLILSLVFDRLIRRACVLPGLADRVGGAVCGFATGFIMAGILAICLQIIPFGGSFLGYSRVAAAQPRTLRAPDAQPPAGDAQENNLWLKPDRFAAGVASVVSTGVFSGSHNFLEDNPDHVQAVGWVGATHAEVSRYAPPKSISFVRTEKVDAVYRMTPADSRSEDNPKYDLIRPETGHEFRMVRVQLNREARDARKTHNFALRQFRLVGQSADGKSYQQYHPIAIQQSDETDVVNRHVRLKKRLGKFWPMTSDVYVPRGTDNQVEVVFEVPAGFKSSFIEYKRGARVSLSFDQTAPAAPGPQRRRRADATTPTPGAPDESRTASASQPSRGRRERRTREDSGEGARVRAVAAGGEQSRFSDELPMTLRSYRRLKNAEVSRDTLSNGHLSGQVDRQENGRDPAVSKFDVPSDKRLLQLSATRLQARSIPGQALSQAIATVQNYFVEDDRGNRYPLAGKYAIATVRGRKYVEVQYFTRPTGAGDRVGKFSRIDESKLQPDEEFVLLFLVDPGVRIVSFSSGSQTAGRDDLTGDNLVAPP